MILFIVFGSFPFYVKISKKVWQDCIIQDKKRAAAKHEDMFCQRFYATTNSLGKVKRRRIDLPGYCKAGKFKDVFCMRAGEPLWPQSLFL